VNSGIYTAYSGLRAQMEALDLTAHNLANIQTTGFKEQRAFFQLLNPTQASAVPQGLEQVVNNHALLAGTTVNLAGGSLVETGRDLDLAIIGAGLLTVQTPNGVRYTRNGNLQVNSQSRLVSPDGFAVLGERGPITLGPGQVEINARGEVFLNNALVDRLKLVAVDDRTQLTREGESLFALPAAVPAPKTADGVSVQQRFLEQSNVNPVLATVRMVEIMRHFEAIQKSLNLISNVMDAKSIEKLSR
jgi:flagellar basal-body rod protein FlgF